MTSPDAAPAGTPPPRPRTPSTPRTYTHAAPPLPPPGPARIPSTERRALRLWRKDAFAHLGLWVLASVPGTVLCTALVRLFEGALAADGGLLATLTSSTAFVGFAALLWTLHHLSCGLVLRRLAEEAGVEARPLSGVIRRLPRGIAALVLTNPFSLVAPALFGAVGMRSGSSLGIGFAIFWVLVGLPAAIAPAVVLVEDPGPLAARRRAKELLRRRGPSGPWLLYPHVLLSLLLMWSGFGIFGGRGITPLLVPWCVPLILLFGSLWGAVNASDYAALRDAVDGGALEGVFE